MLSIVKKGYGMWQKIGYGCRWSGLSLVMAMTPVGYGQATESEVVATTSSTSTLTERTSAVHQSNHQSVTVAKMAGEVPFLRSVGRSVGRSLCNGQETDDLLSLTHL